MRSIEPGIHNPRPWLWIRACAKRAHPTVFNCTSGNDGCDCWATPVIASAAKQSIFDLAMVRRGLLRFARNNEMEPWLCGGFETSAVRVARSEDQCELQEIH